MVDNSKNRDDKRVGSERRTSARYRLASPPEVEILLADNSAPVQASLGDLSRGGCYIETESVLPLETEVTITLKKSDDQVKARARVVRVVPQKGLGLAFTSMEGDGFRILESWLSIFVATSWVAENRRISKRMAMRVEVRVSGYDGEGTRFTEDTHTVVISAYGGLVHLRTRVKRGQRLVLTNLQNKATVECMVAYYEPRGEAWEVGLAFTLLNQPFWPIDFPSADWSPQYPDV